jgi:hypothetical protein
VFLTSKPDLSQECQDWESVECVEEEQECADSHHEAEDEGVASLPCVYPEDKTVEQRESEIKLTHETQI